MPTRVFRLRPLASQRSTFFTACPLPTSWPLRALGSPIVLGVLIALGAQSWWEDRQLEEERRAAAEAVAADLVRLVGIFDDQLARIDRRHADIDWLLDPAADFGAVSDTLWARRVKEGLWELISSRVTVPAFEDLKGSGRLGLLPPEVRAAMTDLEGLAEGLDGDSDDNFQYQIRNLDPWLLENAPLRSILRYDRAEPTEVLERLPDAVLRSRRVENMLLAKLELLTTLETQIVRTRALTVRILALLGDPVPEAAPGER